MLKSGGVAEQIVRNRQYLLYLRQCPSPWPFAKEWTRCCPQGANIDRNDFQSEFPGFYLGQVENRIDGFQASGFLRLRFLCRFVRHIAGVMPDRRRICTIPVMALKSVLISWLMLTETHSWRYLRFRQLPWLQKLLRPGFHCLLQLGLIFNQACCFCRFPAADIFLNHHDLKNLPALIGHRVSKSSQPNLAYQAIILRLSIRLFRTDARETRRPLRQKHLFSTKNVALPSC